MRTVIKIEETKQPEVVDGLTKNGLTLVSLDEPCLENEVACVANTLDPQDKRGIANGKIRLDIKSRAKFANSKGTVTSIDFDLVKIQRVKSDPVIIVDEAIPGTLSVLVKEILKDIVKVDIVKAALLSMDSDSFKNSVMDLARITGEDPDIVYTRCVKTLIKSCTLGLKRLNMIAVEIEKEPIEGERIQI
ncbi:MAG: hypothetical protein KG003_00930 [Bacteroidetes bacterium]|nr:hypothetical protein [Bacteroidota bacterium]